MYGAVCALQIIINRGKREGVLSVISRVNGYL